MGIQSRRAARSALCCGLLQTLLLSCGYFAPGTRVLVQMPEPPPHWRQAFPSLRFAVEYIDAGGAVAEAMACPGSAVSVVCAKEQSSPVIAWPCPDGTPSDRGWLRPAGGFYPLSLGQGADSATLRLSWEDGCAALVVMQAHGAGTDTAVFNAGRLAAALRGAADPWGWDAEAIAESIAAGSFTADDLDLLPCRDAAIDAGPGAWFLESPFAHPCATGPDGRVVLASVPLGTHALFSPAGARRRVWIGETRVIVGPVQ